MCAGACLKGECLDVAMSGGDCGSSAACASGLSCQSGHCSARTLPALGEACSAQLECAGDAVCQDGACAARKNAGESCRLPFECRSLACEKSEGAERGVCADACSAL